MVDTYLCDGTGLGRAVVVLKGNNGANKLVNIELSTLALGQADKLAQVGLQALSVSIQTLRGDVAAAVVHGNAQRASNLAGDLGGL